MEFAGNQEVRESQEHRKMAGGISLLPRHSDIFIVREQSISSCLTCPRLGCIFRTKRCKGEIATGKAVR